METKASKTVSIIGSKEFFAATIGLFGVEAIWLSVTSRFPMAFDEAYHLGLIQFFSHRINPIITSQPPTTYKYGALIQDPSFLYHYLMSFPYRLAVVISSSIAFQVIVLRLIDVALVIWALFILRKLMQKLELSGALNNLIILAFALTPMVALLASQISYDDLLLPLSTLAIYNTVLFIQALKWKVFDIKSLLTASGLCLFSSLIKFAFLPIFLAVVVGLAVILLRSYSKSLRLVESAKKGYKALSRASKIILVIFNVLGALLFVRYYGVNIVKYHNPVPDCTKFLSAQDCNQYYSWNRNNSVYNYDKTHPEAVNRRNIASYTSFWFIENSLYLYGAIMPLAGFYYISGPFYLAIGLLGTIALVCFLKNFKQVIIKNALAVYLLAVSLIYLIFLWGRLYADFKHLGQIVAVNGRYIVPVLPYLYILGGLSTSYALSARKRLTSSAKVVLAVAIILTFVVGGGFVQYISHVSPKYGHLSASNDFTLLPTSSTSPGAEQNTL